MSVRSVIVRLEAEVSRYVAGMGAAAGATDNVARQIVNTRRNIEDQAASMEKIGKIGVAAGAVTVAGLGATAKAAMDWETAWTGVLKTVDGTPQQLDAMEASLRGLAKTLPASHQEIAAVAEAAGQLGVAQKDVVGFTKTMIDLGVSTNLTAEDAATNIAQISNVMGTMAREGSEGVARFGATLVALGNDGASTEADILSMAQRIAGAAATIGASEPDVLALSNTLASMGVRAELGGGVATRVLLKMYSAVQEGGDKLEVFAKTAGMSADEFAKAFGESPVQAMDKVNQGLSRVKNEGGNVVETMKDMGIKGTEEMQVMLALAASGDLLSDSLKLGASSWQENTALVEEAGKRYATTESKVSVAWNNIKDAAIDAGAVLLPMIKTVAESVAGLASAFGDLPAPVQGTLTVLAGVAGLAALAGGGLLILIPKIAATRAAWQALNTSGSRLPATFSKMAKGAGIAAAALIAFELIDNLRTKERVVTTEELAVAITKVANASHGLKPLDMMFNKVDSDFTDEINNVGDAIERITHPQTQDGFDRWGSQAFPWLPVLKDDTTKIDEKLKQIGETMGQMVSGGQANEAAKTFAALSAEFTKNGSSVQDALDHMPAYKSALEATASAAGVVLTPQELLNYALGQTPASLAAATTGQEAYAAATEQTGVTVDGLVESMDKFLEQLFLTGQLTMSSRDANAAYNESLTGVADTITKVTESAGAMGGMLNKNKTDFDLTTEAGRSANDAFQDIARKGMAEVEALSKEGVGQDVLQAKLTQTGKDLDSAANKFGITGGAATNLTNKVLGVPKGVSINSWMSEQAKKVAESTKAAVDNIPKNTEITITTRQTSIFSEIHTSNGRGGTGGVTKASGGAISGPGTGTSDDVPIMASNGEHMFTAKEVELMGGQSAVYRFRAGLHNGGLQQRATGGAIQPRGVLHTPARRNAAGIDYNKLSGALAGTGLSVQIVAPDKATASEYMDEAKQQLRIRSRGGARS